MTLRRGLWLAGMILAAGQSTRAETGGVQRRVVDRSEGELHNSVIRLIPQDSATESNRTTPGRDGVFHLAGVSPGSYTIRVRLTGFLESTVCGVVVRAGETTDVGTIRLELAGCDRPGVICDSFGAAEPRDEAIVASGYLVLNTSCIADLDNGTVSCPAATPQTEEGRPRGDLQFTQDGLALFLKSVNGAVITVPNATQADCSGIKYDEARIRIDGLGPGNDLRVRTKAGRTAHVFFTGEVLPETRRLTLWYVTRK